VETVRIAEIPIEVLVSESWEGVLEHLTSDMDPWNIDLAVLARRYRDYVHALQDMEFEVPGRMVLTCSILLRMKSDVLLAAGQTDRDGLVAELEEAIDQEFFQWEDPPPEFEDYSIPVLRRPQRQVTLFDLQHALKAAMKVSRRRAERLLERGYESEFDDVDPFEPFEIGGVDFGGRLKVLYEKIKSMLAGHRVLSFFRLLERGDKDERVQRFFEVLHLAAEGEIRCSQKEFLGDILIQLESSAG
jgi:chromatin segregation and condensation protein Rec8/ScpA/Scc1 (kleisin family)